MRILVHDYSGHPFQVQLSRALAARGHEVLHVYCSSYETGRGAVTPQPGDAASLRIAAIDLGETFQRYDWRRRIQQELAYAAAFTERAARFAPDIIVSSNDPLFAKARMAWWCRRQAMPWVFWLQDIYSVAMARFTAQRLGAPGRALGYGFQRLERWMLRSADGVVAITDDFRPVLEGWGLAPERVEVIENWAPLEELDVREKENPWSRRHDLEHRLVFLYSGTLGLKHDPALLARLAAHLDGRATVVVISEGAGAQWLEQERAARNLENLVLLPYQPFEQLPEVLATADVLLALLDPDAGVFSVPSKILTYLCAGRPVLAAMPADNLGARTILRAGAGEVVGPEDLDGWLAAAEGLLAHPDARRQHGADGRAYAERVFDIETIAERFEAILVAAAASGRRGRQRRSGVASVEPAATSS